VVERDFPIDEYTVESVLLGKYSQGTFNRWLSLEDKSYMENSPLDFSHPRISKYHLNSNGYRSPEFVEDPEIIYSGCSQTYGIGLPEEYMWSNIMSRTLGVSKYVNLSQPGQSIQGAVNSLMNYFLLYGHPKKLYVLFPDMLRYVSPYNSEINTPWVSGTKKPGMHPHSGVETVHLLNRDSIPSYSKRPHNQYDITPIELPIYLSITSIQHLIQYCSTNKIDLTWGTWSKDTHLAFSEFLPAIGLRLDMSSYVDTFTGLIGQPTELSCHANEGAESSDLFEKAADQKHLGYHNNIHIAESFMGQVSKN
jgi:hypothetical protein